MREYFPNLTERIDDVIAAGRAVIKEKVLLTKEPCLCHGTSGKALALEGEDFKHLFSYTPHSQIRVLEEQRAMEPSRHPESSFGGEAGRAGAWAGADLGLKKRV